MLTTLTLIFNGITLICLCVSYYYQNKTQKLYKARIAVQDDTIDLLTKELNKYRAYYIQTCDNGLCSLNAVPHIVDEPSFGRYLLYSYIVKDEIRHKVLVKRFFYDSIDADDKFYAYRCAEELKEKMEEEI